MVLCLAQFIAMYDTASMTVAMSDIVDDLDTTVAGVQSAITLFTLVMAMLMLPAARLADRWGRRNTFISGVIIYGIGAALTSVSVNLPMMVVSWSFIEGVGAAMMLPTVLVLCAANTAEGRASTRTHATSRSPSPSCCSRASRCWE
jgi:MFS family permease